MKFSARIEPKDFAAVVRSASLAAVKSTIPILGHALLRGDGSTLTVTTNNLDQELSVKIPCEAKGAVTTPVSLLSAIAATMDKQTALTMTFDGGLLSVAQGKSTQKLPILGPDDFPIMEKVGAAQFAAQTSAPTLAGDLKDLSGAVATDHTRPYLSGIYFDARKYALVATQGHVLARNDAPWCAGGKTDFEGFILPNSAIKLLRDVTATGEDVLIEANENKALFRANGTSLTTKLVAGTYPDWQRIVRMTEHKSRFEFATDDFNLALSRVSFIGSGRVEISFGANEITLKTGDTSGGEAVAFCACEKITGKPITIAAQSPYLRWVTESLSGSKTIAVCLDDDAMSSIHFEDAKDASALRIVMPVR